jgi:hypothetical protein
MTLTHTDGGEVRAKSSEYLEKYATCDLAARVHLEGGDQA